MSDFKRRDIINYFNNSHIEQQKKLYSVENFSNKLMIDFFEFAKKYDVDTNIDKDIKINIPKFFSTTNENFVFRDNIYSTIDLIFKAFLEVYENVLIADDTSDYYERSALICKAKISKSFVDFNNESGVAALLETVRTKNVKILIIGTEQVYNATKDNIIKIISNCPALVVVNDHKNFLNDIDFLNNYKNVILIKSIASGLGNTTVAFSSNDLNREMKYLTNHQDISLLNKLQLLYSISGIEESKVNDNAVEATEKPVENIDDKAKKQDSKDSKKEEVVEEKKIKDKEETENKADVKVEDKKTDLTGNSVPKPVKAIVEEVEEEVYEPVLMPGSRQSLISEVTKFEFISVFSSNQVHIYILSKTPLHSRLVENGILLKKYNSSGGEIIRLNAENTSQNIKILKIINEVSKRRKISDDFI